MIKKVWYIIARLLIFPHLIQKLIYKRKLKDEILKEGDDNYKGIAQNIVVSLREAKKLHKTLITRIHPDSIIDEQIKKEATELSTRVNNARRNHSELLVLQSEIDEFCLRNKI
jgi:hypothetical protein